MINIVITGVISGNKTESGSFSSYTKPHHTRVGEFVKERVRKSISISPNAVKRQNYSKGILSRT